MLTPADGIDWSLDPATRELEAVGTQLLRVAPLVVLGVAAVVVAAVAAWVIVKVVRRPLRLRIKSPLVQTLTERLIAGSTILVGVYLALRIMGLTQVAVTVAGGTGLAGLIVGLAFRDIAENFLASVLISVQRPFRIGDTIEVVGHTGVVQKVTMRGTLLMDFDGNHVQIGNSTIYKSTIRNFTSNPKIRINFSVGIGFDSSITRAQQIALTVMQEHPAVLGDPEPLALVERLGSATIDVRLYFWIDGHKYSKLKVQSAVMRLLVRAYEREGISLPDEAREIVFPNEVPVRLLRERDDRDAAAAPRADRTDPGTDENDTAAEGSLQSEVEDIQQQARAARDPEDGADILEEGSHSHRAQP